MSTKHTPGPWQFTSWDVYDIRDERARTIALAIVGENRAGQISSDEAKANARLIAAAPELLASAQEIMSWMDNLNRYYGERPKETGTAQRLYDAIAKATGGE